MFKSDSFISLNDSRDILREIITSPLQLSVLLSDSSLSVNLKSDIVVVAVRFRPINIKNCKYTFFLNVKCKNLTNKLILYTGKTATILGRFKSFVFQSG